MSRVHIVPMVYDHIDKKGIWWKGSKDGLFYIFPWNPLRWIYNLFFNNTGCYFGFLPFKSSHLR
jgi:hypothetical protein